MTTYGADAFTRSTSNAWGTADTGGSWTLGVLGGTTNDFDVNGTQGTIACGASSNKHAHLQSISQLDVDQTATFSFANAVTGSGTTGLRFGFDVRGSGATPASSTCYRIAISCPPTGTDGRIRVYTVAAGTETSIVNYQTGVNFYNLNTHLFHIRASVVTEGATTRIKVRYWLDSETEPYTTWHVNTTNAHADLQDAGYVGVYASNSSTNAADIVTVDNYLAESPLPIVTVSPTVPTHAAVGTSPTVGASSSLVANDSFDRTSNPGWGTADYGGAWTTPSFSLNSRNTCDGSYGVMAGATGAATTQGATLASVSQADVEAYAQFNVSAVVTGLTGPSVGLYLRTNNPLTTYIRVRCQMPAAGGFTIWGNIFSNSTSTPMGSQYVGSDTLNIPGQVICMRAQARGSSSVQVRAKVWLLGDPEPDWQFVPATYSTGGPTGAGGVGVYGFYAADWGGGQLRVDNFSAYPYPNIPTPPSHAVVAPAPTVAVFDGTTSHAKIVSPLSQLEYIKAQVDAGIALGGAGNKWSRMYANLDTGGNGYVGAGGRYFSKTYDFSPQADVDTVAKYNRFIDDMCAALMLVRRGVISADSSCYTLAKDGILEWVTGPNRTTWFHSLSADESGKLYFHWGFSRMCQAWSLLLELDIPSDAEIVAFRGWIKAVPFRGSLNYLSFQPIRAANPATKEAEATLMAWNGAGNWQTGICVGLLDAALLTDSSEGDELLSYAHRFFTHVFKATVWHPGNTYRCAPGSVISDPNWQIEGAPLNLENSQIRNIFTPADNAAKAWGFATHTIAAAALFEGMTNDYCRDQGHDAMTNSHLARYILTYMLNVGDPFADTTWGDITWGWDALAAGMEMKAAVLNEFYDVAYSTYGAVASNLDDLDATSWTPDGIYSGFDWFDKGFGKYNPSNSSIRTNPTYDMDDGRNGVGGMAMIWLYILKTIRGYDVPELERFAHRNADIATATNPRAVDGPQAGRQPSSTPYTMDFWSLFFNTDVDFVTEPEAPPVPITPSPPSAAVVVPIPTVGVTPDVQLNLTPQRTPTHAVVATAPTVGVLNDPGDPDDTESASPPTTKLNEKGFGATYPFNKKRGFR